MMRQKNEPKIEVEKKFLLNAKQIKKVTADAVYLGRKKIRDIYWDNDNFELTKKDWWLRERDGDFELKTPLHAKGARSADQYREITDSRQIRQALTLKGDSLPDALAERALKPFADLLTTRQKYKQGDFNIDIDQVSANDFDYAIVEIELLVARQEQMQPAIARIKNFAHDKGLSWPQKPVAGKLIVYIAQKKPVHYRALCRAGVVSS